MNKAFTFFIVLLLFCNLNASEAADTLTNKDYPPTLELFLAHAKCQGNKEKEKRFFKNLSDEQLVNICKLAKRSDIPADAIDSLIQEIKKRKRDLLRTMVRGTSILNLIRAGHKFQIKDGCLECGKLNLNSIEGLTLIKGISRVTKINLKGNHFTKIPEFDLGCLGALKVVTLAGNPIDSPAGKKVEKLMITPRGNYNIIYRDELTDAQLAEQTAMMGAIMLEDE